MHEALVVFSVEFASIDVLAAPNPPPHPTPPLLFSVLLSTFHLLHLK